MNVALAAGAVLLASRGRLGSGWLVWPERAGLLRLALGLSGSAAGGYSRALSISIQARLTDRWRRPYDPPRSQHTVLSTWSPANVDVGALTTGLLTGLREGVEAALIVAIILALVSYIGFTYGLGLQLPPGILAGLL